MPIDPGATAAEVRPRKESYATQPTGRTLFFRTFFPWQAWRFAVINWRMIRLIFRSHRGL